MTDRHIDNSIARAQTDEEITATFEVMAQLRPDLRREDYLATIRRMMTAERYRLAAVVEEGVVRAVAGYRPVEMLYSGRILYVDDLVTDERARSGGHGRRLLGWLKEEARALGCVQIHLDSGVWRAPAHRFYFREGFTILGFHFAADV